MAVKPLAGEDRSILRGKWPVIITVLTVAALVLYFYGVKDAYPRAGSATGMGFGITAFCIMIFLISYKIRKHVYSFKMGQTSSWLSAHIYLGVFAAFLVLMHAGINATGPFNLFLFALFLLATASGIIGALIFKANPVSLAKGEREVVSKAFLVEQIEKRAKESDKEIEGMSEKTKEVYKSRVKPAFASAKVRWWFLLYEERELMKRGKAFFEEVKNDIPDEEKYHFSTVGSQLLENQRLAFKLVRLEIMDVWLAFHMPLSGIVVTAVLVHIFSVLYY